MSGVLRFLGVCAISLLIAPIYLLLSLGIIKAIFSLRGLPWTRSPNFQPHVQWILLYFVIYSLFIGLMFFNYFLIKNEFKDVELQMIYLAIVMVLITCTIVLILFWSEYDKSKTKETIPNKEEIGEKKSTTKPSNKSKKE